MTWHEAFELVLQKFADFAICANLIERIALAIAWRPHALDIRVPIDRVAYNRERTVACLHFEPLRPKGVTFLGQVSRYAGQHFLT